MGVLCEFLQHNRLNYGALLCFIVSLILDFLVCGETSYKIVTNCLNVVEFFLQASYNGLKREDFFVIFAL